MAFLLHDRDAVLRDLHRFWRCSELLRLDGALGGRRLRYYLERLHDRLRQLHCAMDADCVGHHHDDNDPGFGRRGFSLLDYAWDHGERAGRW